MRKLDGVHGFLRMDQQWERIESLVFLGRGGSPLPGFGNSVRRDAPISDLIMAIGKAFAADEIRLLSVRESVG